MKKSSRATCSEAIPCRVRRNTLVIPAFEIRKHGQVFVSPKELAIDLRQVEPGRYQVTAVHNFLVEDRNPDLTRCWAGVFLAGRRADGTWEDPERFPMECRALQVIAELEVRTPPVFEEGAR